MRASCEAINLLGASAVSCITCYAGRAAPHVPVHGERVSPRRPRRKIERPGRVGKRSLGRPDALGESRHRCAGARGRGPGRRAREAAGDKRRAVARRQTRGCAGVPELVTPKSFAKKRRITELREVACSPHNELSSAAGERLAMQTESIPRKAGDALNRTAAGARQLQRELGSLGGASRAGPSRPEARAPPTLEDRLLWLAWQAAAGTTRRPVCRTPRVGRREGFSPGRRAREGAGRGALTRRAPPDPRMAPAGGE